MKPIKSIRINFLNPLFKYLSIILLISISHAKTFNECFPGKFNFICEDPYNFLLQSGFNVESNIIEQARLRPLNQKFSGGCTGGIFKGNSNTYFIKDSNVFTEFIGSRLMNLIVGKKRTPVVKIVKDQVNYLASTKLKKFITCKKFASSNPPKHKKKSKNIRIQGEAELAIAMDFLGIVDRHSKNMGYIKKSKKLLAARVDFDASFAFEIRPRANTHYQENSNHLNLNLLYLSMQTYPDREVFQAIQKIVEIPDEKIIMTIFECWATFSRIGYQISLDSCFALAKKLIERKGAFQSIYNNPDSVTHLSLQKDPFFENVFKDLKRKKKSHHKHRKKKRYH